MLSEVRRPKDDLTQSKHPYRQVERIPVGILLPRPTPHFSRTSQESLRHRTVADFSARTTYFFLTFPPIRNNFRTVPVGSRFI